LPTLEQIFIYPIKSLDGISVSQATVLPSGALKGDREYAMVDQNGHYINGKHNPRVHGLRSHFDLAAETVSLSQQDSEAAATFHLEGDRADLESWLSDYFAQNVRLIRNSDVGFPDDTTSPGPTIISIETLKTVASWFPGLTLEQVRRRFRTNLEIAGEQAFWEDHLFGEPNQPQQFQVGDVQLLGINPCQRCIVPVRDPQTGEAYNNFQRIFSRRRQETLPSSVVQVHFNHFYRLAVNTRLSIHSSGGNLQVGDSVRLHS